ncbi:MAG: helix-turn-helix transcriptional regulator [Burkholderiales bacterium]|nr:helix-turn-helix transcriptional regulator [Burkholderiales bacterium]
MPFIDLIASIVVRLSRGEALARSCNGEFRLDPTVGVASFDLGGSRQPAVCTIGGAELLVQLAAPVIGVMGVNPVGRAVAEFARAALGAEVVFCSGAGESHPDDSERCVAPEEVERNADIYCFPLPLPSNAGDWLLSRRAQAFRSRAIIVAWHRSASVERALTYLGGHIADDVPLGELAAQGKMSKFHLLRLFKATLGITPHRCHLLLRIHQARTMLHQGMRIPEVALALGFFDHAHLNRTFRLFASDPPSWYQHHGNFFQDRASGVS